MTKPTETQTEVKKEIEKEVLSNITSSTTILFKIVFPTIWITFFTLFTIAVFVTSESGFGTVSMTSAKIIMPSVLIIGGLFLLFTLMSLKKIEISQSNFYITNYFKTVKYPYETIANIEEQNYILFKLVVITFKEKGTFGKKIFGIQSKRGFERFLKEHPHFVNYFLQEA